MTKRLIVGPFNRVEGDLEIRLDVAAGQVREAFVTAPLFRDFEHLMLGRWAQDALVIAPRICGICSVSQSAAALSALADAAGLGMPWNGRAAINLTQALENAADHLIHFSLFFMPDFARPAYEGRVWFKDANRRFKAGDGDLARAAAQARSRLFQAMGVLAGKWPHSLALQPGGSAKPVDLAERVRLLGVLKAFRRFLEDRLFGCGLEEIAASRDFEALRAGLGEESDAAAFLRIADDLDLWRLGESTAPLMSFGAFPDADRTGRLFKPGLWQGGEPRQLDLAAMVEDVSRSWLGGQTALHPAQGITEPAADKPEGYSWCKSPRLHGQAVEVGALARQLIDGQPAVLDLISRFGSTVATRVAGRLIELARLVPAMENWAAQLDPSQPFCLPYPEGVSGRGVGLVEAARGALGHWLTLEDGKITHYQVVAPTTWNFSPRDGAGAPGPVEAALAGAPVEAGQKSPLAVQHIVRSFDPCMACTVH